MTRSKPRVIKDVQFFDVSLVSDPLPGYEIVSVTKDEQLDCPCYDLPACPGQLDPDLSYEELREKYGFGGCGFEGA